MKKTVKFLILSILCAICLGCFTACGGVEFKINFVVDGEIYATVRTGGNEVVKMPDNPAKDDYAFDGWFWDKDTWEKPFTANSLLDAPLSSDMNVYAKWTFTGEIIPPEPEEPEPASGEPGRHPGAHHQSDWMAAADHRQQAIRFRGQRPWPAAGRKGGGDEASAGRLSGLCERGRGVC